MTTINLTEIDPTELDGLGKLINILLKFVYPFGGIILFFMIVWAGFDYFFSEGKPEKLSNAKGKITYAIIGYTLLILSFLIVKLIASIIGLDDQGL